MLAVCGRSSLTFRGFGLVLPCAWLTSFPGPFLWQYVGAPVAYIQQIFVKSSVFPWHKNLLAVDVFRSPLSRAFQLVEEIRNHVLRDRYPLRDQPPCPLSPETGVVFCGTSSHPSEEEG